MCTSGSPGRTREGFQEDGNGGTQVSVMTLINTERQTDPTVIVYAIKNQVKQVDSIVLYLFMHVLSLVFH